MDTGVHVSIVVTKPKSDPETLSVAEKAEFTLGRSSASNIRIDTDPMVSRRHALLSVDPPRIVIRDLESTNGIYVNKVKYGGDSGRVGEVELKDGDSIRLGSTFITIAVTDQRPPDLVHDTTAPDSTAGAPAIAGYTMIRLLGIGGMGRVYLAKKLDTGERVAIKILDAEQAVSQKRADAFNREIAFTKSISHPNIVKFYAAGLSA
ncbi:MAG: serine/threonine-protein kinase, partial [Planctomycetes bacterium]|nr:serine/threonine-protein kinase [Planctomycetota bacterium]